MKENFFKFDEEEKTKLMEKLHYPINLENDNNKNFIIDTNYYININGLWLGGSLSADQAVKLTPGMRLMTFKDAELLNLAINEASSSVGIAYERLDEKIDVFKICSYIDNDNYVIITILVGEK